MKLPFVLFSKTFFSLLLMLVSFTLKAQTSGDVNAIINEIKNRNTPSSEQTQQQNQTTNEDGIEIQIEEETQSQAAVVGNIETKLEFEDQEFTGAVQELPVERFKQVFLQGHFSITNLPGWYMFAHLASEQNKTSEDTTTNNIIELNPRKEFEFGNGKYGLELGHSQESLFDKKTYRLRPFIEYWFSDDCRTTTSFAIGKHELELGDGEPDYHYYNIEPSIGCFVGPLSIAGLYLKREIAENFNDDNNAVFLDGTAVKRNGKTKDTVEWRFSPYYHQRFLNEIGMTLWAEFGINKAESTIDHHQREDIWSKYVLFLEYPIQRNMVVYGELSYKTGTIQLADANLDHELFGLLEDYEYTSTGVILGLNIFF